MGGLSHDDHSIPSRAQIDQPYFLFIYYLCKYQLSTHRGCLCPRFSVALFHFLEFERPSQHVKSDIVRSNEKLTILEGETMPHDSALHSLFSHPKFNHVIRADLGLLLEAWTTPLSSNLHALPCLLSSVHHLQHLHAHHGNDLLGFQLPLSPDS